MIKLSTYAGPSVLIGRNYLVWVGSAAFLIGLSNAYYAFSDLGLLLGDWHGIAYKYFADFKTFYYATRYWRMEGVNPYDEEAMATTLVNAGLQAAGSYGAFLYPPLALYVLTPLTYLPYDGAILAVVSLGTVAMISSFYMVLRREGYTAGVWALAVLFYLGPWHNSNLFQGQVINMVAACLVGLALPVRGWVATVLIGAGLGLLLAAKPLFLFLAVVLLVCNRQRVAWVSLAVAGLALILSRWQQAEAWQQYAAYMPDQLYLPWSGPLQSDLWGPTDQSLNSLAKTLDEGITNNLPMSLSSYTGKAIRLGLYGALGTMGCLMAVFMAGVLSKHYGVAGRLPQWVRAAVAEPLYIQVLFVMAGSFCLLPITWFAYLVFFAPWMVLALLHERGACQRILLIVSGIILLRLTFWTSYYVDAAQALHGPAKLVALLGIMLVRSSTGLALLGLWVYLLWDFVRLGKKAVRQSALAGQLV